MADKTRIDIVLLVKRGFKGEQTEDFVRTARHFFGTPATPSVDRGADIVCCCDAVAFESAFKNEIEDVEIDTHEGVDTPFDKRRRQTSVQLVQTGQPHERLAKAVHR